MFTAATSDLNTLKTELKKGATAVQTQADRIDTSVTDEYSKGLLYLLNKYVKQLVSLKDYADIAAVAAAYNTKYPSLEIPNIDTATYASLKTSATSIYNAMAGTSYTED